MSEHASFTETSLAGVLVLHPSDPIGSARAMVARDFTLDGMRTLQRHREAFWNWNGRCYEIVAEETVRSWVWKFLETAQVLIKDKKTNDERLVDFNPTVSKVENVIAALRAICHLEDRIEAPVWLPPRTKAKYKATELFACANGLLHLPTGELLPATPAYFGVSASDVTFDPKAAGPKRWLKFVEQTIADPEAVAALQEIMGYVLAPDTSQQKIFLAVGPRRSGKGTTARIVTKLLGRYSVTGPTMSDLGDQFGLEALISSPLAIISDARIGSRTDKARVAERLLSISGEDQMTVARKFRPAWTGHLITRIWIMTNETPALTDGSSAIAGRFIVVLYKNSFYNREDPKLTARLEGELSGILNWAIEGYRRLIARGHFVQPSNAKEAVEEIEILGAPVKAFLRDRCFVGPKHEVRADALFGEYVAWAEGNRQSVHNKEWFARELRTAIPGLRHERRRKAGADEKKDQRELFYIGVQIAKF